MADNKPLNQSWLEEQDYNQTLQDLELRENIKTLMTIGQAPVKQRMNYVEQLQNTSIHNQRISNLVTLKHEFSLSVSLPLLSALPCAHPLLPHHHHRLHRQHPGGAGGGPQQEHA